MSNILEKNINALAIKDKEFAEKIKSHIVTDVPQLIQENGFYNLKYKNYYLHNKDNPLQEALEIFSQAENSPVAIHFIYGLGLGYLFQAAAQASKGTVILFEPDLNILRTVFTLVDFSKDILKNNVYVTSDLTKAGEYIYQKSNMKNVPLMLSTIGYRQLDEVKFNDLIGDLQRMVGSYGMDLRYTRQKFYPLFKHLIMNIPDIMQEIPLTAVKDFYKGKTAVIVSAGPTLDRDIEIIKKYRDNIVLIVVGTAMKTIAKHNIVPDFLCIIEVYDSSKQIEGIDLSDINFITEPFSHPNLRKFKFKRVFSHIAANLPVNLWWSQTADIDISEYWSKGTVSYMALNCARILGCSKLVLVGQDLAYVNGQCYSKDSAYKDLICKYNKETGRCEITAKDFDSFCASLSNSPKEEERIKAAQKRLSDLNASLYYVKGIQGGMIPTESVYAAFIKPLTEFTEHFKGPDYINSSLIGAQIDGFRNLPLEEALQDSDKIEDRNVNINYEYNIPLIRENLLKTCNELVQAQVKIKDGQALLRSLNNELNRYKNLSVEVLKALKKVSVNFMELSSVYVNQCKAFDFITTAERIDVEYEMKMMQNLTNEAVTGFSDKLKLYYDRALARIDTVLKLIRTAMEDL